MLKWLLVLTTFHEYPKAKINDVIADTSSVYHRMVNSSLFKSTNKNLANCPQISEKKNQNTTNHVQSSVSIVNFVFLVIPQPTVVSIVFLQLLPCAVLDLLSLVLALTAPTVLVLTSADSFHW